MMDRLAYRIGALALLSYAGAALAAPANPSDRPDGVDAITLYGQGAAVVSDTRRVSLTQGAQHIDWPASAAPVADSLWLDAAGVRLTGFSLVPNAPDDLAARVGRSVTLEGQTQREGTLVSVAGDTAFVRVDDRIERITPASPVQLSWPAEGASGGLRLDLASTKAGPQDITLVYERDAPGWQAAYTARFDDTAGELALQSMAIIDNATAQPLVADQAWLIAGQPSRVSGVAPMAMMMNARAVSKSVDMPEAVSGLYRYPIAGGLDIPAGTTRAIALRSPVKLSATRSIRFVHNAGDNGDATRREHADLFIESENSTDTPLPAGPVRVHDTGTGTPLIGADRLSDTPAGAPIELALGEAFDITGTRRVQADDDTGTQRVAITLHNAADAPRTVEVVERLGSDLVLVGDNPKPTRDGVLATWSIEVPAHGQRDFSYRYKRVAGRGD